MTTTVSSDTAAAANQPAAAKRKPTLLIVDDEEGPRQSLEVIFKDEFVVLLAHDGPEAIELAQKYPVDVAVSDIRMSGMSGMEVLERLKYVNPAIEVVMITAFETTDTMHQALRLRACDYINKPFDVSTIRAAVAKALQRHTLESEIHNNAEKLQALMTELQNQKIEEQIAQTRGEIYASIIHDINGPLTVISGFIQLINNRLGNATRLEENDLEFLKDRLKIITRQVTNCIEISRRYLSFLRRQSEDAPRVGVNQLLKDMGQLVLVHPSLQNHEFVVNPLAADVVVRMNGTDFIQVLLNLAVNAFQCTPQPHRVEISGEIHTQSLDLTQFKDSPQTPFLNGEGFDNAPPIVAMTVRDNGPGIRPEVLGKIFEPYFTTKGSSQGTGLGLNIVQRLVRNANGALRLQTRLGEGTAVTVYFPAVRLPAA
jgi:signal transduction histidine kinase